MCGNENEMALKCTRNEVHAWNGGCWPACPVRGKRTWLVGLPRSLFSSNFVRITFIINFLKLQSLFYNHFKSLLILFFRVFLVWNSILMWYKDEKLFVYFEFFFNIFVLKKKTKILTNGLRFFIHHFNHSESFFLYLFYFLV